MTLLDVRRPDPHPSQDPAASHLPSPPSDAEKFWYMGRQHRWLLYLQAISFALIAYSVMRFSTADVRLLLFAVPMSLYTVTLVVSLLSSSRKKRTSRADHDHRVRNWNPGAYPTVDVFLPSAGEPMDVLANTYHHVSQLNWPATLTVWVLDDSGRSEVRELAEAHGFEYRSRPDRGRLKKAGNLGYGYAQSEGDLIAIFDADFVPRTDYLHELVPYFDESDVGIVQSPQFFDTPKGMHWLQRSAGATQELFYRWIQPARDRSRAAICVGTCAVYRRAALQAAGGFAQIGHSEDVHTGVNLMKAGFFVRYVPILVSKGICPDTINAFVSQQYRWCTGSMSLLADATFHRNPIISRRQRLCFWAGFLYYISTGLNAFVAPMPAIVMLWYLPDWVEPMNSIWLVGALVMWLAVIPVLFKSRWRIDVIRAQYLYSFAHAVAIIHILTGRTKGWVATGAAGKGTPLATTVSRTMRGYLWTCQLLIWVGLVRGTMTYGLHEFWAMLALGVLSSYIILPMLLTRSAPRVKTAPASPVVDLTAVEPAQQRASGTESTIDLREAPATVSQAVQARSGNAGAGRHAHDDSLPESPLGASTATLAPFEKGHGGTPEDVPAPVVPEDSKRKHLRLDIQGMRAVAVLLVVLYHAGVPGLTGGYIGVDVFFVISGFLITGHLLREVERNGKVSLASFWANRIRRLLPSAMLVIAATAVAYRIFGSVFQLEKLSTELLWTAVYGFNYRLASQGVDYQAVAGPESPLQHFWSLAVEEQFYLVWPIVVALLALAFRRRFAAALLPVLLLVVAGSLYASITVTGSNEPLAYFSLHTRAWELGAGALVAVAAVKVMSMPRIVANIGGWLGLGMILWSAFSYDAETPFPGSAAIVPVAGAALLIMTGVGHSDGGPRTLLSKRPLQGIGRISYAWYLWHWPFLIIMPFAFARNLSWIENVNVVLLALWVSVISYYVVEAPALRTRWRPRTWLLGGLGLSAGVVATSMVLALTVPSLVGQGGNVEALELETADVSDVQRAVLDGTSVVDAPSNLTPTLDAVAEDQPITSFNGCHADFLLVDQGECVYGDPAGEKTMVLMGDSHAQQWFPGLNAAAKESGWKLISWTKAACPVATMDWYSTELGRPYTECTQFRQQTIAKIAALKPDRIIVGQSDSVPGTRVNNVDWAENTAFTLNEVRAKSGSEVAYLLDTPLPAEGGPECVAAHLDNAKACTTKTDDGYPYDGRLDLMADTLQQTGITTIDPRPWVCSNNDCPAVVGNLLVYRDASHLSTPYSEWLTPMLEPLFTDAAK